MPKICWLQNPCFEKVLKQISDQYTNDCQDRIIKITDILKENITENQNYCCNLTAKILSNTIIKILKYNDRIMLFQDPKVYDHCIEILDPIVSSKCIKFYLDQFNIKKSTGNQTYEYFGAMKGPYTFNTNISEAEDQISDISEIFGTFHLCSSE
ncbi:hypothetical protein EDEG_02279 [Edhazardia aedis USNM 41457]|uniref:Uncharacterized protein n=1 Tax=Edhazardia aedis (strain USNM 41457) TaxID=1003232 RepID=J9D758_EDHAE|nr:hypothetical protein EDEG_02279 [Edhazardia aedis USNM 41457]|eukprot:EJW03369.1 hypothetical protein EDEG_02279 [Edhazardia aedis USNM 41457]